MAARPGLVLAGVAFLLGCAMTALFTLMADPFVDSLLQFVVIGVLVIAAVTVAFMFRPGMPPRNPSRHTPAAWLVG